MINVLLIEDSAADARLVQLDLESIDDPGFSITHVTRLEEAFGRMKEADFDIILSDLNLPDSKGFNTFVKVSEAAPDMPIILLTGFNDESVAMNIVKEGAEDYIVKGEVKGKYLARAIQYAIERRALRKKLQEQNEQLEQMLRIDPLTGLYSRRYIISCVNDEAARHNRYGSPVSVIHLDVDDFKHINDDYGHNSGDQALRDVAEYIQKSIREVDKAARYGGDEFLVLLPDSDLHAVQRVCEKLNAGKIVSQISPDRKIELSLSIGAASAENEVTATQLIDTADYAMLTAKKSGKGRFFVAAELIDYSTEEEVIDQLQETRNTLREVICQFLGAALSEIERRQDISDGISDIMGLAADRVAEAAGLSKEKRRVLHNVISIIRFQELGIAVEMGKDAGTLSELQRKVLRDRFNYNISLIRNIRFLQEEADVLCSMHEHFDGTGFPEGTAGEDIPLLSRVTAVLYEYAKSIKESGGITAGCIDEALNALEHEKGRKFDPGITDTVLREITALNDVYKAAFSGDVLIIEDDPINVRLLGNFLGKAGYTVSSAASLAEGREKLSEKDWKIVFLDIVLPDGDGRELLPAIAGLEGLPIIAVTSSCFDEQTIQSVKEAGADIYCIKPIKLRLLMRLLASYRLNPEDHDELQVISGLTSITELR